MNKACEYCQYNGPYGSVINPCENCSNNDFQVNVGFPPVETTKTTFYMTTTTDADEKTIQRTETWSGRRSSGSGADEREYGQWLNTSSGKIF